MQKYNVIRKTEGGGTPPKQGTKLASPNPCVRGKKQIGKHCLDSQPALLHKDIAAD